MENFRVTEITNRIENLNGEEVYVVDSSMEEAMDKLKKIVEIKEDNTFCLWLKGYMKFIGDHPDFAIAFIYINMAIKTWIPCLIYKYEGEWRRVSLQNVHCLTCDWKGIAANTTNPGLYDCLKNWCEILRELSKLPFYTCPKCGGKISTEAIWLETIDE